MLSLKPMQLSQFNFNLPEEQIARYPLSKRSASRLLCLSRDGSQPIAHHKFADLPLLLKSNDLLVLNDTKVIPARLYAEKAGSGGRVEILIERLLDEYTARVHLKSNHAPKTGILLNLLDDPAGRRTSFTSTVIAREDAYFILEFNTPLLTLLNAIGHTPLPPYIKRDDVPLDKERYQTIYAKRHGAVAAPTAGLHFDAAVFDAFAKHGVEVAYITLHVGAGTFQPVRCENIIEHKMHSEYIDVSQEVCDRIQATKQRGGRVIAGGTTTVRALESVAQSTERSGEPTSMPFSGETDIFITPGYNFRIIDAILTNFHLPKSTLIMLVCAFAGYENTLAAYREAIDTNYRFFSYGDAMLIS